MATYRYTPGEAVYMLEAFGVRLERLIVRDDGAYRSGLVLDTPGKILAVRRPDLIVLADEGFLNPAPDDVTLGKEIVKRGGQAFITPRRTRVKWVE